MISYDGSCERDVILIGTSERSIVFDSTCTVFVYNADKCDTQLLFEERQGEIIWTKTM